MGTAALLADALLAGRTPVRGLVSFTANATVSSSGDNTKSSQRAECDVEGALRELVETFERRIVDTDEGQPGDRGCVDTGACDADQLRRDDQLHVEIGERPADLAHLLGADVVRPSDDDGVRAGGADCGDDVAEGAHHWNAAGQRTVRLAAPGERTDRPQAGAGRQADGVGHVVGVRPGPTSSARSA